LLTFLIYLMVVFFIVIVIRAICAKYNPIL
jgi:hypothetical protein